ncbi:MAG TPA: uracil phosphoribosyltransferase [Xanthomonadales bacterium]|nr:uracil phosphoribosyltransferase [Xanthomonadales bacterium]
MAVEIRVLGEHPSLFSQLLAQIRDLSVQQERMRFRRNLERLGEMFAYEISKELEYVTGEVTTPLGVAPTRVLRQQPVLAAILRAGLPLHQGLLNYFDAAGSAFISACRKHHGDADSFDVEIGYLASPSLNDRSLILCDPMLATGSSMVLAYKALLQHGVPRHLHAVAVLASEQGMEFARQHLPANTTLWLGAVDPDLTSRAYIVPGLGDAGDLAFGNKQ